MMSAETPENIIMSELFTKKTGVLDHADHQIKTGLLWSD